MHKIAIVIPAYNEGEVIKSVITSLCQTLADQKIDADIIVVDDGSTDNTYSESKSAGALIIRHILNSGSGDATATGLQYARMHNYELAVTADADGQHAPDDVVKGIRVALEDGGDLLIGSRLIDATGMSRIKVIGNKGLSILTYVLFGINVTDSQSGMRVFSRNALEKLRWRTSGYEFCSEMLWRAKQQKLVIKEFPIKAIYSDYSRQKGQNNWNALNIIKSLLVRRIMEIFGE